MRKEATMNSPKLKPCPFCGNIAPIFEKRRYDATGEIRTAVVCGNERCRSQTWLWRDEENAAAAWNRRAGEETK